MGSVENFRKQSEEIRVEAEGECEQTKTFVRRIVSSAIFFEKIYECKTFKC